MINQKFKEYVTEMFGKIQKRKNNQNKNKKNYEDDDITKLIKEEKPDTSIIDDLHEKLFGENVNEEPITIKETNNLAAAVIDLQNSAENPRKKSKWNDRYSMKSP